MDTNNQAAMLQALMDRAEIEDLFVRYYSGLGGRAPEAFAKFFLKDAELDVNGIVGRGYEEITGIYRDVAVDKPNLTGTFRMILSNQVIKVTGNTATAQMMWAQTLNDTIKGPPRLIEQGMEYNRLVKTDGKWLIARRVVVADSGLPDMMDETYPARKDFKLADLK